MTACQESAGKQLTTSSIRTRRTPPHPPRHDQDHPPQKGLRLRHLGRRQQAEVEGGAGPNLPDGGGATSTGGGEPGWTNCLRSPLHRTTP